MDKLDPTRQTGSYTAHIPEARDALREAAARIEELEAAQHGLCDLIRVGVRQANDLQGELGEARTQLATLRAVLSDDDLDAYLAERLTDDTFAAAYLAARHAAR